MSASTSVTTRIYCECESCRKSSDGYQIIASKTFANHNMYRSSLETVYPKGLHGKTVTYRNNFQTILESSSIEPSFDTDVHMDYEYTFVKAATDDQANEQTSEPGSEDDSVVDSDSDSDVEIIEEVPSGPLYDNSGFPDEPLTFLFFIMVAVFHRRFLTDEGAEVLMSFLNMALSLTDRTYRFPSKIENFAYRSKFDARSCSGVYPFTVCKRCHKLFDPSSNVVFCQACNVSLYKNPTAAFPTAYKTYSSRKNLEDFR
ncbi:unnamed protein product [Rhizopus microsporus]